MTVVLHASDLHFGKADPAIVEQFFQEIERQRPDLVILSGDFTQIGSKEEFIQAQGFIRRITAPVFTIPGNHDIPRYGFWERLTDPMAKYRKYIAPMEDTTYEDDDLFVVGINTARPYVPHWNWANGMISKKQVEYVERQFRHCSLYKARIFVCHHPLVNFSSAPIDTIVWNSKELIKVLEDQHVHVVLTGHIHHASILPHKESFGPVMIGSASATSTRLRQQTNGYNLLKISPEKIDVELIHWDGQTPVVFESLSIVRQIYDE